MLSRPVKVFVILGNNQCDLGTLSDFEETIAACTTFHILRRFTFWSLHSVGEKLSLSPIGKWLGVSHSSLLTSSLTYVTGIWFSLDSTSHIKVANISPVNKRFWITTFNVRFTYLMRTSQIPPIQRLEGGLNLHSILYCNRKLVIRFDQFQWVPPLVLVSDLWSLLHYHSLSVWLVPVVL